MGVNAKSAFRKLFGKARRLVRSPYTRTLEAELERALSECARLRSENRALLNSILGIAGIPPVPTSSAELPRSEPSPQAGPEAPASRPVSPFAEEQTLPGATAKSRGKNLAQIAAPLRKRSWQQINRTLELEAARKKPQRDTTEA